MKTDNIILEKTYRFAVEITRFCRRLRVEREYDLASQLWRSGTSIGANVEEAQAAQSRADFLSKMSIAAKEARESHYWLRLTQDAYPSLSEYVPPLFSEIETILKIITSIVKSTSEKSG